MTSTRLPGKVLLPLERKPVLEHLIQRVRRAKYLDEIVVATTVNAADDPITELCKKMDVKFFRGSEEDVLKRVLFAAKSAGADLICELMGDSPLIDPILIDQTITNHLSGFYDYTSNFHIENTFPLGFAVQIFSVKILEELDRLTDDPVDRSHVSCFIYHNPRLFKLHQVCANDSVYAPDIRLALDTKEDYQLITKVFSALYEQNQVFSAKEVVRYLRENPELLKINGQIKSKTIEEG